LLTEDKWYYWAYWSKIAPILFTIFTNKPQSSPMQMQNKKATRFGHPLYSRVVSTRNAIYLLFMAQKFGAILNYVYICYTQNQTLMFNF
jgi:hypothetical protein